MNPLFPRREALKVAEEIYHKIKPFTERCQLVGSMRRQRRFVHDIEFLYIPKLSLPMQGMMKELLEDKPIEMVDMTDLLFNALLKDKTIAKRPNVRGGYTWGPENKLALHVPSGISVDFFATSPDNWWVSLVIRTGGKRTNLMLTTGARRRGLTLHAYGSGFENLSTGERLPCTSERDVFRIAGLRFLEPQYRP